ncbi:uncharacterized protein LOC107359732 [Tetranychus urticae]|uniref:uncharacterized protein LOC107359732 n=1 Tax=Tetranychus urticae TaxID=32264 RepID=UPI00077BF5E4|nr:uncharacterized protein LOC107359732 [Tetranychus urticae]
MKICKILSLFLILCGNIIPRVLSENSTNKYVNSTLIDRQIHLITSGFSSVFWNYIINSDNSLDNVSNQCSSHLNKLIESSFKGQPSAFKFLSLSGSQPNNFLDGNYAAFGSYDTCLSFSAFYDNKDDRTSDQNAKGQYCLTSFEPDLSINGQILGQLYPHYFDSKYNFTIKVGFCVPSVCSQNDVQQIITQAFHDYSWRLVDVHSCDVKTNFLERLMSASQVQQILFWLLVGLVCIVVLGTCIDAKNQAQEKSSLFWIQQFSAIKSVKSLFHKTDPESRIPVLDGIRLWVLSSVLTIHAVMWHTIINASFLMEDYEYLKELPSKIYSQPFIDDWIVEGLFFLGGVNAATTLFRKMKPETPVSEYLKSIFRRAALLVPILLPAMAIEVILPLFGSGPIYQSINQYRANICVNNFWRTILHIQNNSHPLQICASSTWSLAVEWQLFALACILVYIYKRNYRLGLTLNILTVIFGLYRVIMIFLNNNLIVNIFVITKGFRDTMHRAEHYYISTEARICYYFCGILMVVILAGNYEAKIKQMFPNDKIWVYALLLFTLLSSSLWNCFGMKIGTITTVIYICLSKFTVALWCFSFLLHHGRRFRLFLAQSKSIDMYIYPEERDPQFSTPNKDTIAILNNNSELLDKTEINRNHSSKIRKVDPLEFIVRVTRPAFFVHSVVYAWYFTSLRSSIPSNLFGYVIQIVSLITLTIFFGFFFHILVIGPVERINYISSKRKIKAKTHSS